MISERIGTMVRQRLLVIGQFLANLGFTPNLLTIIGLVLNVGVAIVIATGHPLIGGILLIVASAFDMLDGAVARATGLSSAFGGFLDSTIDRYSEVIVFGGVLYYMLDTEHARSGAFLTFVAAAGALLISYARARAEAAGYKASVGLLGETGASTGFGCWIDFRYRDLCTLVPGNRHAPHRHHPNTPCVAGLIESIHARVSRLNV